MKVLKKKFYNRSPLQVAPDLLGKILVRKLNGEIISGRIVEVEAYLGSSDQAAHSFKGLTKRNASLFKDAGHAYVHTIHTQNCLDVVVEGSNIPHSVLIRALEPLEGIELMKQFRNKEKLTDLASGPGKLCQALNITKDFDGLNITKIDSELFIMDSGFEIEKSSIVTAKRIGISKAAEFDYRYYIKNSKYISRN